MENSIRLALYHEQYDQDLDDFALRGDQLQFTAMPADVIDEAIQNPDKDPMVILHEEKPVGFFILHKNSEYVEDKDASQYHTDTRSIHFDGTTRKWVCEGSNEGIA